VFICVCVDYVENIMMYYPEANVLVPRTHDLQSRTPSFKSVAVQVEKEN